MEEAENKNTGKRRAKGVGDGEKVMAKGLCKLPAVGDC